MTERLVVKRCWWLPFVVEVWERAGEGEDWKRGPFVRWIRRGAFLRRRTANRFARWLEEKPA